MTFRCPACLKGGHKDFNDVELHRLVCPALNKTTEKPRRWMPIPHSPGYEVSDQGEVRNGQKIYKGGINSNGYRSVMIKYKKCNRSFKVHRLVMLAFHGPSKLEVNHINGIKSDNRLENLEYVTRSENLKHAYTIGLRDIPKGEQKRNSKLKEIDIYAIFALLRNDLSDAYCGELFGVSRILISHIRKGKAWKHLDEVSFREFKSNVRSCDIK